MSVCILYIMLLFLEYNMFPFLFLEYNITPVRITIFTIYTLTPLHPPQHTTHKSNSLQEKIIGPTTTTTTKTYTLSSTLLDLFTLSILSILSSFLTLYRSYHCPHLHKLKTSPYPHINPLHRSGERKTRDEIEEDALEESFVPWTKRYALRYSFPTEVLCALQGGLLIVKCFARLSVEIAVLKEEVPHHPVFWVSLACSGLACVILNFYLEKCGMLLSEIGESMRMRARDEDDGDSESVLDLGSSGDLEEPLLSVDGSDADEGRLLNDDQKKMAEDGTR